MRSCVIELSPDTFSEIVFRKTEALGFQEKQLRQKTGFELDCTSSNKVLPTFTCTQTVDLHSPVPKRVSLNTLSH